MINYEQIVTSNNVKHFVYSKIIFAVKKCDDDDKRFISKQRLVLLDVNAWRRDFIHLIVIILFLSSI